MTKQEQIEEVTRIINKRCEAELGQVHANSKDGKVTKTVDTGLIAKDIINAGYSKTIWHKVADGDLPTENKDSVLIINDLGLYKITKYHTKVGFISPTDYWYDNIVAWTDLPIYEELDQ